MDIERLKDLKWYVEDEVFTQDVRADILALLDEAIARQSVKSEDETLTNLVSNGNFVDATGWTATSGTGAVANNTKVQEAIGLLSGNPYGTHNLLSCDCVFCKALDLARTALQAYQPWVSVDDRLPEKPQYDWVLVHITLSPDGFVGLPHVAELRRGKWFSTEYDLPIEQILQGTVTHWKPLPEAPKGE